MATRTTLKEAKELKASFEANHPDAVIRITDRSETKRIGKAVAETKGFEIIEDGRVMVTAKVTSFDVQEVKFCEVCGAEFLTHAVGEAGNYFCSTECKPEYESTGSADFDAYAQAEAWYYREEGAGVNA